MKKLVLVPDYCNDDFNTDSIWFIPRKTGDY